MKKYLVVIIIFIIVLSLGYFGILGKKKFEHHSLLEELHKIDTAVYQTSHFVDTSVFTKVHSDLQNVHPFYTEKRKRDLTSFPCTNCHSVSLSELRFKPEPEEELAHWDIEQIHGSLTVMNCSTCHGSSDFDQLKYLTGAKLDYDESYKLCAQCHTSQFKDWQGGAHGKSLSGWEGPRLAQTCVSCHDPHKPKLEKRWPSRLNKTER